MKVYEQKRNFTSLPNNAELSYVFHHII